MRVVVVATVIALAVPARAQGVPAAVDNAARHLAELDRDLDLLVDVAYALENPEDIMLAPSRLYDVLLQDPVTAAIMANIAAQYRGGYVTVGVTAGATADLTMPGAVNGAFEAGWQLPLCRVLGVNASGLGSYRDGEVFGSYALGGTACLPLPADTVQVSYTHRENVRTTLLAKPVVLTDRRAGDVVDITLRFYRWLGTHNQIDFAPMDVNINVDNSAEDSVFGTIVSTIDVSPVTWRRRGKGISGQDQLWDFVHVHAIVQDDDTSIGGRSAETFTITPLVIDGIHLRDDMTIGANLGFEGAHAFEAGAKAACDPMQTTPCDYLVERSGAHAEAWIDTAVAPYAGELRASHAMYPTFDGQIVRDNRLSARIQVATPFYSARLEGFLGRDQMLRNEPGSRKVGVAGGAADIAWAFIDRVHLVGRLEAATSLAAVEASEPVKTQFDFRATIGVTTSWEKRW